MTRLSRLFQQALPRRYQTVVGRDGAPTLVLWKMWLGHCYSVLEFPAAR